MCEIDLKVTIALYAEPPATHYINWSRYTV